MVQVPLLLMAVRGARASMRIVEGTRSPGQGVEQWLSGLGFDTISIGVLAQLLKAPSVSILTVGVLLGQGDSELDKLVGQLALGVRRPFLKAVQDARAGRQTVLGEARGAFDAKWDVAVPVHGFLTHLDLFDAASVNTIAKALIDGGRVRTKGSLLALTSAQLQSLAAPLPRGLQKPLLDAVQDATESGRGWRLAPASAPAAFTLKAADQVKANATYTSKGMLYSTCKLCNGKKDVHFMSGASRHCFDPLSLPCSSCGKTATMHHGSARACLDEAGVFAAAQVWAADRLQSGGQQVHPSRGPTAGAPKEKDLLILG